MTTLNVSSPDTLSESVQERIAEGDYNTVDDYLRELIHEDQRRKAQEKLDGLQKLDGLLQEGLDSGPSIPMTAQDWQGIRLSSKRLMPVTPSHSDDPHEAEQYHGGNKAVDKGKDEKFYALPD